MLDKAKKSQRNHDSTRKPPLVTQRQHSASQNVTAFFVPFPATTPLIANGLQVVNKFTSPTSGIPNKKRLCERKARKGKVFGRVVGKEPIHVVCCIDLIRHHSKFFEHLPYFQYSVSEYGRLEWRSWMISKYFRIV